MNKNIKFIIEEMKTVYRNDDRPWIIGYSGGKDSSVVVQLVYTMLEGLDESERNKKVYIVSSDTLVENPIILKHLHNTSKEIHESASAYNLPLETVIVHPDYNNTFWTNIIGKGFPTPKSAKFRWCTERLKIMPSNSFIQEKVKENGEVVVLLGVRKAESVSRKKNIEKREIDGYLLNPHATLDNTYVYSPIVDLSVNDVWEVLLSNGGKSPWGGNNNKLFGLYADGDGGECPFIMTSGKDKEINTPSCGNTRFGCWTCTVVKKDKSLSGFIESGEEWLIPLEEFREWILSIRDNREYRDKKQRSGRIYRRKILNKRLSKEEREVYLNEGYEIKIDEDGEEFFWVEGLGPFNYKGRKLILEELLKTEEEIGIELIRIEEIKEIENIWNKEFDLKKNELQRIYKDVKGKELSWAKYRKPILEDGIIEEMKNIVKKYEVEEDLINRLLILTNDNKFYSNKSNYRESLDKLLKQQWLHRNLFDEEYVNED